jgi:hypothetical protein
MGTLAVGDTICAENTMGTLDEIDEILVIMLKNTNDNIIQNVTFYSDCASNRRLKRSNYLSTNQIVVDFGRLAVLL